MIDRNPLLVDYFSENLQLLYMLERMKPHIIKEWGEQELVHPCYIKE